MGKRTPTGYAEYTPSGRVKWVPYRKGPVIAISTEGGEVNDDPSYAVLLEAAARIVETSPPPA